MHTILVPTDFSKCANNAMMYALELAQRMGASVRALYVVYPNEGVDNNVYDAFFIDDYIQQRLRAMKVWAKKFTRSPHLRDVDVQCQCLVGLPVSTICEAATTHHASLIVMGTTGASGLRDVLLGSIAGGVVAHSKKPVFVIPPKASFRNNARFALATDFKMPLSRESLQVLREILHLQHTGLNIVHVLAENAKQPSQKQEDALSEKLGTIPHNFHYLHSENIPQAIHNFLEATDANGLVAVAHEHSLFRSLFAKSMSRTLAHHTNVPLLVLHDKS
jgi:nucleotide-binding universal stress UspA family protein